MAAPALAAPAGAPPGAARGGRFASLFASAAFGLSGAAFTLAMLLLARALPVEAFGRLTLAIALFNIVNLLTPLGLDQMLLRQKLDLGPRLLLLLLGSGAVLGGATAAAAVATGGLRPAEAALTALSVTAGGIVATAGMGLRVQGRAMASMALAISASYTLLLAGGMAVLLGERDAVLPLALVTGGNLACAGLGWRLATRQGRVPRAEREPVRAAEALSLLGLVTLGTVSLQIERILIPIPLGLRELATFGVLASVAIFPFRLLAAGVGFTLPPRLRGTRRAAARRRIVLGEAALFAAVSVPACALLAALGPWLTQTVTGGGYAVGHGLVLAACVNGAVKVVGAFPRAILVACGSMQDIVALNGQGLLWLGLTVAGALWGARYGLEGLLWGASLGGLAAQAPALRLAWRRLCGREGG